jgi:23S rRNA (cytosine1962-C5)-methyltransferase
VATVTLKPGHVQPVWAGHPWVYAQAIQRIEGGAQPGDEVVVRDAQGNVLGRGLYSPGSAIPVRLYTRDPETRIDASLFGRRIQEAVDRRRRLNLPSAETNAFRVIHAEGDDLPGIVVDLFSDVAVLQLGTLGVKRRQNAIVEAIVAALGPRAIIDRSSARAAEAEGFKAGSGVLWGDDAVQSLQFFERGLRFAIPLDLGQKTGFYLDQRPLRARVEQLAQDCSVLDVFCYVGAVSLAAARGGAKHVVAVDSSVSALAIGAECAALNGLAQTIQFERNDAYEALKHAGRQGGYDLVVCDPPKLAPTRTARRAAASKMRRLAAASCRATKPGGLLVLCSCSAALGLSELTRAVALGARDVGLRALVLERWFQGPDHPVPAAFGEGLYLATLLAEVTSL